MSPSIVQLVIQGGSFGLVAIAVIYLIPKFIRDLMTSREALSETFDREIAENRKWSTAQIDRIVAELSTLRQTTERQLTMIDEMVRRIPK